ncbi:hypothetical protein QZH41_004628 [Actinostola sp. cb2023]|nr:hypothetical protein QZH41_004628 [Actinostola sp. cb2023]
MSKETVMKSIEELKNESVSVTMSPRKCKNAVRCAVLTKSPLKSTNGNGGRGFMFTMRLCDREPCSTTRAVCFDEEKFDCFEPMKTYVMEGFKLKKGRFGSEDMEMVITEETKIKESSIAFKIDRTPFNIGQIVRGETENVRYMHLTAKVLAVEDMTTVGKYPNQKEKRDILLADKTGEIPLVLWRDQAKACVLEKGNVVKIQNAVVSSFNKKRYVTTTFETSIELINDDLEVDESASHHTRAKPHVISSIETAIEAIKEYRSVVKCVNCRSDIVYVPKAKGKNSSVNQVIIRCNACSTVFMAKSGMIVNECKFLVGEEWYLARTTVVQYILERSEPSVNDPTEDEIMSVLNSKFLLRLDLDAKKIEHSERVKEEPEGNLMEEVEKEDGRRAMDEATEEIMNGANTAKKLKSD